MSACPSCHWFDSQVRMTRRLRNGWVRRHRRCMREECLHTWQTYEIPREHVTVGDDTDLREVVPGATDGE